jgi:SAM-dependent methyltransferase
MTATPIGTMKWSSFTEQPVVIPVMQKRSSLLVFLLPLFVVGVISSRADFPEEIPFVPTPIEVVDRMLEIAEVQKDDVVYDLGSGDGRVVIRAAKKYGARGVGIEMDQTLLDKAHKAAEIEGVSHLVEFRAEDALKTDLSPATVVTLYMLPWFNEAMKPSFQKYLKSGSRIVAHDFGIEGWKPDKTEKLPQPEKKAGGYIHYHTILLWNLGKN